MAAPPSPPGGAPAGGKDSDVFRDTPVRYLGYANELGEAFRTHIPRSLYLASYAAAVSYALADATHKGVQASSWADAVGSASKASLVATAVLDTAVWQGLASVAIPGLLINRCVHATDQLVKRSASLPGPLRRWAATAVGLALIPVIVGPVDKGVHMAMDTAVRRPMYSPQARALLTHHEVPAHAPST